MPSTRERTGVLVVRVWLEPDDPPRFRARVTSAYGVDGTGERGDVFASAEAVLSFVSAWLMNFANT
jgi:hypothetical protein